MCQLCDDWEKNLMPSDKAFQLIGQSLKMVDNEEDRDHLMELCDRIVDSLDKYSKLHT